MRSMTMKSCRCSVLNCQRSIDINHEQRVQFDFSFAGLRNELILYYPASLSILMSKLAPALPLLDLLPATL